MRVALITNYLAPYRVPLYERLAERHSVEVICFGGDAGYVPPWLRDLDAQLAQASFPARRLTRGIDVLGVAQGFDAVIAPFAGGAMLPGAYLSARREGAAFILWASVWAFPRSVAHALAAPVIARIYRRADAVLAYGEHIKRFVASVRGRDDDVFVAPQSVEADLFARKVGAEEVESFRARHGISGPLVLYVGRLVREKGIEVLADAWARVRAQATLVVIGDGPLAAPLRSSRRTRMLGTLPRAELPIAYAAASAALVPSIRTPRFLEPWGLVCNEALHQGCPVVATTSVGAVAGGLVRDDQTGLVVPAADPAALAGAIERLLDDPLLRDQLGSAGRRAVAAYTHDAMADAFDRALAAATTGSH